MNWKKLKKLLETIDEEPTPHNEINKLKKTIHTNNLLIKQLQDEKQGLIKRIRRMFNELDGLQDLITFKITSIYK